MQSQILMESFSSTLVNINETCKKHAAIVPSLIGAHAISGCDSVPKLFGIGKQTVLKYLQQNIQLTSLGNISSTKEEILNKSSTFIAACYGVKNQCDSSKVRYVV